MFGRLRKLRIVWVGGESYGLLKFELLRLIRKLNIEGGLTTLGSIMCDFSLVVCEQADGGREQ